MRSRPLAKRNFLDFEQPIAELENKIEELRNMQSGSDTAVDISEEIDRLGQKSLKLTQDIYRDLSPWKITRIARHPDRPYTRYRTNHPSSEDNKAATPPEAQ